MLPILINIIFLLIIIIITFFIIIIKNCNNSNDNISYLYDFHNDKCNRINKNQLKPDDYSFTTEKECNNMLNGNKLENYDNIFNNSKNNISDIVLITEYFIHKNITRDLEIKKSINENDFNKFLNKIYLMNENSNSYYYSKNSINKINNIDINKRCTFKDMFEFSNTLPNGTIVIISNNDISFDDTIDNLRDINLNNVAICLGRRDINNSNNLEYAVVKGFAQDAWIFQTPIKIPNDSDFHFGVPGCDNHIAYLLKKEGYDLLNIPWIIKAKHNHKSEVRKKLALNKKFNNKLLPVLPLKLNIN